MNQTTLVSVLTSKELQANIERDYESMHGKWSSVMRYHLSPGEEQSARYLHKRQVWIRAMLMYMVYSRAALLREIRFAGFPPRIGRLRHLVDIHMAASDHACGSRRNYSWYTFDASGKWAVASRKIAAIRFLRAIHRLHTYDTDIRAIGCFVRTRAVPPLVTTLRIVPYIRYPDTESLIHALVACDPDDTACINQTFGHEPRLYF